MRDIDIRRALRSDLEAQHAGDPGTLYLDELALCQGSARVDFAVVNGVLHGFEIKSEHDTLARLPAQCDIYSRALDFVTIVVGPTHAMKVSAAVPAWWGIMVAEDTDAGVVLHPVRQACDNPSVDPYAQAQLLWREEALSALEEHDMASGVRSKPRQALWRRLAERLPADEVGCVVRERLKLRAKGGGWRG